MSEQITRGNGLTDKQQVFVNHYIETWDKRGAALAAGYSETSASARASQLLKNEKIRNEIDRQAQLSVMSGPEWLSRLNDIATLNVADLWLVSDRPLRAPVWDWEELRKAGHCIRRIRITDKFVEIWFEDRLKALELIGKAAGYLVEAMEIGPTAKATELMERLITVRREERSEIVDAEVRELPEEGDTT